MPGVIALVSKQVANFLEINPKNVGGRISKDSPATLLLHKAEPETAKSRLAESLIYRWALEQKTQFVQQSKI